MPELPEVETVVRQLARVLPGQRLVGARILDSKLAVAEEDFPRKAVVLAVSREGKQIVVEFGSRKGGRLADPRYLVVHLRMTGSLVWISQEDIAGPRRVYYRRQSNAKPRAELRFNRGTVIFEDVRRFGTFRLHTQREAFASRGIDPLSEQFSESWFAQQLAHSRQEIKAWLLRQDKLTGVGNIYACEALFRARIHPRRICQTLNVGELKKLRHAVRQILIRAIECSGTTFSDYRDVEGQSGGYQRLLKVYDRETFPCRRCRTPIERITQQQRSTYLCPRCQCLLPKTARRAVSQRAS